jgi:hypothetical protein
MAFCGNFFWGINLRLWSGILHHVCWQKMSCPQWCELGFHGPMSGEKLFWSRAIVLVSVLVWWNFFEVENLRLDGLTN